MTQEEREAGNVAVAVSMGWVYAYHEFLLHWRDPNDVAHPALPDLFSDSPDGAMARERAEEWLEEHEWPFLYSVPAPGGWAAGWSARGNFPSLSAWGTTRAESRATAIIAAFQAISERNRAE